MLIPELEQTEKFRFKLKALSTKMLKTRQSSCCLTVFDMHRHTEQQAHILCCITHIK